ncbi:hypothetical protein FALBO_1257 [Fusarium albosuccineum]|uniref:Zn(2)-C6 fungal-type domain-containing protein n=1 Tax=Fusarium albosuccineum TaxID=1237068 RepID=A0A8H4PHR6_9HYPO|nr:hypothetical protein FALBO_1257 [Fusarium albosuccineum]
MHSSPHPNQVRSACERCRRQKLRCSRPVGASASCARCTRLNLTCQPGLQRRVGRPPKKDLVLRKPSEGPMSPGNSVDDMQFLQGLLDDPVPGLNWNLDTFCSYSPESLPFPMENWPAVRELDPPEIEQQIIVPSHTHFQTLSRLHEEIHKGWEHVSRIVAQATFKDFICDTSEMISGYENVQVAIKSAQEFLIVIKALHRQLGTRTVSSQGRSSQSNAMALILDPCLSGAASPSSAGTPPGGIQAPPPPVFDSPTMFLIISCYVQLIKHIELVVKSIYEAFNDTAQDLPGPAPMMHFADVPLIEASPQFVLFSELVRHILSQINLVLGLPSPWSGRSAWTGLLTSQRYRDMVNVELGAMEGMWTTRPAKLLEINRVTKEMLIEFSMMGIDA